MRRWICGLTVAACFVGVSVARAATIDFESATTSAFCDISTGGTIDGFTLSPFDGVTAGGFNNTTGCHLFTPTANSGSQYMANYNSLYGQFTKDVGTFTLVDFFVHQDARKGTQTVRFQGLDGIGGNVLYTTDVVLGTDWQLVSLNWVGVKTFTWDPISVLGELGSTANISIDDFQYLDATTPVPEPATLLLLGTGLGIAGVRRRPKKRA